MALQEIEHLAKSLEDEFEQFSSPSPATPIASTSYYYASPDDSLVSYTDSNVDIKRLSIEHTFELAAAEHDTESLHDKIADLTATIEDLTEERNQTSFQYALLQKKYALLERQFNHMQTEQNYIRSIVSDVIPSTNAAAPVDALPLSTLTEKLVMLAADLKLKVAMLSEQLEDALVLTESTKKERDDAFTSGTRQLMMSS